MLQFKRQLENCQLVHVDCETEGNPLIQPAIEESLSSLRLQQNQEKCYTKSAFIFALSKTESLFCK